MQLTKVFFGPDDPWGAEAPTLEEKNRLVTDGFAKFVGNERAIRKLQAAEFDALGREDHLCREMAFALFGPPSAGKTTLAKLHAKVLDLPFVEVSPKSIKTLDDLFLLIDRTLKVAGVPLVEVVHRNYFVLPPVVIFLDEVHALSQNIVDGLLKPTEYSDGMMVTESGRTVNCYNVCWMLATTDEGRLFDAFRTRFSPINLKYLSKKEVAKIIKLNNPDFDDEVCDLVAKYNSRVVRKGLEFARYMKLIRNMFPGKSWESIALEVARDEGIDEFGMHESHLAILKALGQGPVSKARIVGVVGKKIEEVENFIMPVLLTETEDSPALVEVTSKGYTILPAGLAELEKRGIAHKGNAALSKER